MSITTFGIADCHGIESITIKSANAIRKHGVVMLIRALANRQRHAVLYYAKMELIQYARIKELVLKQKYVEALTVLKEKSVVRFPTRYKRVFIKSWALIPDPTLDKWR